ncbi:unnamed protein product [Adineta steineri]|uniref:Uncharacterized protein n=1 Tax=Adineta steineri TaxID=433720 RepID=A0A814D5Y0_9BILA|nr:unnamed protein product [Adineta steineri]CAF0949871.1 unnamed protein product [Adineta steineri]
MRAVILLSLLVAFISTINCQWSTVQQTQRGLPVQQISLVKTIGFTPNTLNNRFILQNDISRSRIPFPQCISSEQSQVLLNPSTLQKLLHQKLQEEERKLKQERVRNDGLKNNDIMDFDAIQLRADALNGALVARAATKVSAEIMSQLGCETNSTLTERIDRFLRRVRLPPSLCAFNTNPDCSGFTRFRTITGVCNNLERPYEGSSQTAYTRLLPAAYDDGISKPRSRSVLGGPLPACRQISVTMSSKPVFDTSFNNLFVGYGQFLVHDISLATPVTDSGRTPVSSCSCSSQDHDMCTIMEISSNDPFMAGQKCMTMPATAQAFTDQQCTLGVKDQMNGNSHYIDLSVTYGSTKKTAVGLRAGRDGFLKTAKKSWSKFEIPPGQREGKSCTDSTETQKCFAGGDSRLMENVLLSGIQAQWLRIHNLFAKKMAEIHPEWKNNDDVLYDETKKISSALHQRYTYDFWLPILIGKQATQQYTGDSGLFSRYDPNVRGVVINEAVTAALRLHTLVRDLYTRCTPQAKLIDQVWLHDILAKSKLAYDGANNGVDSLLCGALYDYGFAGDANFGQDIHHRLFETTTKTGEVKRHDIVAINICRAREHGIPGYNAFRELCGLRRASRFEDFADTMGPANAAKLQSIYDHPEDVDLFIGMNHENHVPGGLVGPVSACIIGTQFRNLKYGDRLFYKHEGQFTPEQLTAINKYTYNCFICHSTDIEKVALNPFKPPNDQTNPLGLCSECPAFDFNSWR